MVILTLEDDAYPSLLREIADPPPVLYVRGAIAPDDEVRVAIVGSRRATPYGLGVARGLAEALGGRGIAIVSGLARGIDAAAHLGALDGGARTIAVMGSGLAAIYPNEHTDLADRIASTGAVISEYPLDSQPLPGFFPRRNRIVSGLSAFVVVVEAARTSGALVTARLALEQGRELGAVPGSIRSETSTGTNGLLRDGAAHAITKHEDVLDALPAVFRLRLGAAALATGEAGSPPVKGREREVESGCMEICEQASIPAGDRASGEVETGSSGSCERGSIPVGEGTERQAGSGRPGSSGASRPAGQRPQRGRPRGPDLRSLVLAGSDEAAVLGHLSHDEPIPIDELAERCGLPFPRLLGAISALEIKGLATCLPGDRVAPGWTPAV
jgi:DNA protecting protein DprA